MGADGSLRASCHCGRVKLSIACAPAFINECNCSLCSSHGAWWGYYETRQVQVSGDTQGYSRTDHEVPAVEIRFCGHCGCTTHWVFVDSFAASRPEGNDQTGVNMRLFDPIELAGIELRFPDGRNIAPDGSYEFVREKIKL